MRSEIRLLRGVQPCTRTLNTIFHGTGHKDLTVVGQHAEKMAKIIIEQGLGDLGEVWGLETTLYYPDLYAGATDIVGVYDGQPAIVDFKQSNNRKEENGLKITSNNLELTQWPIIKYMVQRYSLE
jgi:hypothetical protein